MEKTAGSILAGMLLAKENGAPEEEIEKKRQELTEQTKKQLGEPLVKVSFSTDRH